MLVSRDAEVTEIRRHWDDGLGERRSLDGAARRDPCVRLAGRRRDVLEVGVVVQDDRAVVLGHCGGQQVDHARGAVVTPGGHAYLDIARAIGDYLADRQDDVEFLAPLGDRAYVAHITAGVPCFQVHGDARRGGPVGDQPRDDVADQLMLAPGVSGRVDQVQLPRAGRYRHRRAARMISGSPMSGPIPSAYGSSMNERTNTVYVGSGQTVSVISGRANAVTATIPVAGFPQLVAVNPRTNAVYVAASFPNEVAVISGRTNTVTATIPLAHVPVGVAVDWRTNTIYVTNVDTNRVWVI